ncbi:thioredoxin family protein [Bacillus smithii]|uniref:thioredoxin family protein n=1 Tax=Bacillus smithii TaxID=1479 RepID=UPI002E23D819|nr:thioredoxin family protein [Bacillus smithii]
MKELISVKEVDDFVHRHSLSFLYISRDHCSVCHDLLPKIQNVMADFPNIQLALVNADHVPEVAGRFTIFTAPVLLLFVDGKEVLREVRFVHVEPFLEKVNKIYRLRQE